MLKQKVWLAYSAIFPSIGALLLYPLLSRTVDTTELGLVLTIIMMVGIFGAFEVLKPVYIPYYTYSIEKYGVIRLKSVATLSLASSIIATTIVYVLSNIFLDNKISEPSLLLVSIGGFLILLSNIFWAALDSTGKSGTAQAMKATLTLILYTLFGLIATLDAKEIYYALSFLLIQAIQFMAMYFSCKKSISWTHLKLDKQDIKNIWHTINLNASKLVTDFLDRLIIGKISTANFSNIYFLIYDLTSKSNIAAQYTNVYLYPALCKTFGRNNEFLQLRKRTITIATINYVALSIVAISFIFFGSDLLTVYLGGNYSSHGLTLSFLTLVAANHSLAFYSQSLFRSSNNFKALSTIYTATSLIGLLIGAVAFITKNTNIALLLVLIIKSPGIAGYLHETRTAPLFKFHWQAALITTIAITALITTKLTNSLHTGLLYSSLFIAAALFITHLSKPHHNEPI